MNPEPLYRAGCADPAYQLRYAWTGWLRGDPSGMPEWEALAPLWERDGLRLLEHRSVGREVQAVFSARPDVSPITVTTRVKGRLQHAWRESSPGFPGFTRMVALRSVGKSARNEVEAYIARQVPKEGFVDPRFRELMEEFTVSCLQVDLSRPSESARGRYWYNSHLVLVVQQRCRIVDRATLGTLRDTCFRIAAKHGYEISRLAVMPDHLHVAMRGEISQSPQDIALCFQNNLAYVLGQMPLWEESHYVGTFGEYDMGAIRVHADRST